MNNDLSTKDSGDFATETLPECLQNIADVRNRLDSLLSCVVRLDFKAQEAGRFGTGFYFTESPGNPKSRRVYLVTNWHNLLGRRHDDFSHPSNESGHPSEAVHILGNGPGAVDESIEWELDACPFIVHERQKEAGNKLVPCADLALLDVTDRRGFERAMGINEAPGNVTDMWVYNGSRGKILGWPSNETTGDNKPLLLNADVASDPLDHSANGGFFHVDVRARAGMSGSPCVGFALDFYRGSRVDLHVAKEPPAFYFLGVYSGRINNQSDIGRVWHRRSVQFVIAKKVPINLDPPDRKSG